jgi:hypothetical protein
MDDLLVDTTLVPRRDLADGPTMLDDCAREKYKKAKDQKGFERP